MKIRLIIDIYVPMDGTNIVQLQEVCSHNMFNANRLEILSSSILKYIFMCGYEASTDKTNMPFKHLKLQCPLSICVTHNSLKVCEVLLRHET